MAGGKATAKPFFTGAILLQPADALDAFVRSAGPGNELVYCEAPSPMYGETWSRAGELARQGLVRTHERRREGGGRQYFVVRTAKALPRQRSPQERALADRATAAIFAALKRAANLGLPCPSDSDLHAAVGLATRAQAQGRVRRLIDAGLISSTLDYEGGVQCRVVTIEHSPHAGAAAGKFTALPKKWRALMAAAAKEAAAGAAPQDQPGQPSRAAARGDPK